MEDGWLKGDYKGKGDDTDEAKGRQWCHRRESSDLVAIKRKVRNWQYDRHCPRFI